MVHMYKVNLKWFAGSRDFPVKEEPKYFDTLDEARDVALKYHRFYKDNHPKAVAHEVLVFRIPERGPSLRVLEYTEDTKAPATLSG